MYFGIQGLYNGHVLPYKVEMPGMIKIVVFQGCLFMKVWQENYECSFFPECRRL